MEAIRYYSDIGQMPMPPGFRYAKTAARGRPRHEKFDTFYMKHPTMNVGKRAKIFSPFDALKGFNDAVASKEIKYVERRELCENDCEELNEKIAVLSALITDSRAAKENNITVRVTYYVPCDDPNSEAFLRLGRYVTAEGVVRNVDTTFGSITVGKERIELGDVAAIEMV
ncbi:MAG: hypothetical protein IKH78_07965 [Ruminococcus sp.]|nr:hypothetical protein [Ruminococcus sp.]